MLAVQAEQEQNRKLCGKSYNKADIQYIYTDALGNRIKPNYLTSTFPEFMTKHGFNRMRFHDLRHSCASLLLANGVSLKEIQDWLGHSDFAITANIYAHLEVNSKLKSAEKMSWISDTSLALEAKTETITPYDFANESQNEVLTVMSLPNFIQNLIAVGTTQEVIQAWLKQVDFTSEKTFAECFQEFQRVSRI